MARHFAIHGAALAALLLGASHGAKASDACDGFAQSGSLAPDTGTYFTSTNFAVGDHIMGSASGPQELFFYLRDASTGLALTPNAAAGPTTISYTVTRSTANHTINIYINNLVPALAGNGYAPLNYSFSCKSAN